MKAKEEELSKDELHSGERGGGIGVHRCTKDGSKHGNTYGDTLIKMVNAGGGGVRAKLARKDMS